MQIFPTKFQKISGTQMRVEWNSGESTVFDFKPLRFFCRCAECVDEWTRERRVKFENIPADIAPVKLENVGRYAVQIEWTDGHRAGIYPYDLLYHLSKHDLTKEAQNHETTIEA